MELYKDKEQFIAAIVEASRQLKINEALIEKDYFVIHLLSELNKNIPGLLFKGGTCCSHAYHAIDRFSEDIDLSLDSDHFGRAHNSRANHKVVETCENLGFEIINGDEVSGHSHGNFNCYYVKYPAAFSSLAIKPYIQIEMAFYQKAYPHENKMVNSLLGEWLENTGNTESASLYGLTPFLVCVQKLERTFVDKVFALCDYFERNEIERNSRHIYDLFKISQLINVTDLAMIHLIESVRADRKKNKKCISAADGYDVNGALKRIKDSSFFKGDYDDITMKLLINPLEYDLAITVIDLIVGTNIFG